MKLATDKGRQDSVETLEVKRASQFLMEWRDELARMASFVQLIQRVNNSLNVFRNI